MRVMRILTRANLGGPARQALNLWRADPVVGTQTVLVVGTCLSDECELDLTEMPVITPQKVDPGSRGLVRALRLGRATRPWRDLQCTGELRRLIRRFRPHVVHTHTSQAGFFGRRAALAEGVSVVAHTFHGHVLADYTSRPVAGLFRRLEARLARRTDLLFAVSDSCRAELHGMGVGDGRIDVLPPATQLQPFADCSRSAARRAMGVTDDEFLVGWAGRLVRVKRPELFVDLLRREPRIRGVMFGTGALASRLRTSENLSLRGAVQDLHRYLAGLDALVITSKREGCPLVSLEAFAAGVPVLGLDVPGVRDVLAGWGSGLLIPEASGVVGLQAGLRRLMADEDLARTCAADAKRGLSRFDSGLVAARLGRAYRSVLDQVAPPGAIAS